MGGGLTWGWCLTEEEAHTGAAEYAGRRWWTATVVGARAG
jgi:hypothetical protein